MVRTEEEELGQEAAGGGVTSCVAKGERGGGGEGKKVEEGKKKEKEKRERDREGVGGLGE